MPMYPYETNNIDDIGIDHADTCGTVDWNEPRLAAITSIRLLTDRDFPMWDVSYVIGRLQDGRQVRVRVPFHQLPKRDVIGSMVQVARRDNVYLKGLCGNDIGGVISRCW